MYPRFCRFPAGEEDPYVARAAAESGMGTWRAGLALGERDGMVEVVVGADGRTATFPAAQVTLGLPDHVAMALMDAVEEAIEDALEQADPDPALVVRLEDTLALLDQYLGDEGIS